jgi:hypothetical protein
MEEDLGMASNIKINNKDLLKDVDKELKKLINKNIPKMQRILNEKIGDIVFQRLVNGLPIIQGNDLAEIGVPDINSRLISIMQTISKNVRIKISPGKQLRMTINIIEEDYSDILSLPESVYAYTSSRGSGVLEWVKWILLGGSGTIIGGFDFSPVPSPFSRTGGGLMVAGGGWSVPSNLAGTSQNNILTRALDNIEKDIKIIVSQELQRILK